MLSRKNLAVYSLGFSLGDRFFGSLFLYRLGVPVYASCILGSPWLPILCL